MPGSPARARRWNSIGTLVYNIHFPHPPENVGSKYGGGNTPTRPSSSSATEGVDNPLPYADDSQAVTPSSIDAPVFDYNTNPSYEPSSPTHFSNR